MSAESVDSESKVSWNRANIPARIRRDLGIDDGDKVRWQIEDNDTLPVQVVQQRSRTFAGFDGYDAEQSTEVESEHDMWGVGTEQMPRALVDTTVLFAAAYRSDSAHEEALPILKGIDTADLPEGVILEYVLAETLNGLTTHAGHDAAVDFLDRAEENTRFHIDSLTADAFATANALFPQYERFSFVDASMVAQMQAEGLGHLSAFDEDFDGVEDVYRLDSATNPSQPE